MGHPDHDLVRSTLGGELDRLVEHRDQRVEAFERELLLAEERPPEVLLEALDLREPLEERQTRRRVERAPVPPRLDRLAQPDPLGVVGDVLDLVRDRAGVGLAQVRQRLEQGLAGDVQPQQPGGDAGLNLRRQRRVEARLVERRVAHRLRAQRIEPCREVAVHADRLDERHRGGDRAEHVLVGGEAGQAREPEAAPSAWRRRFTAGGGAGGGGLDRGVAGGDAGGAGGGAGATGAGGCDWGRRRGRDRRLGLGGPRSTVLRRGGAPAPASAASPGRAAATSSPLDSKSARHSGGTLLGASR